MKGLFKPDDAIHYQGESFEYRLVHRPRVTRRVHLELAEDGGLLVVAPPGMSRRAVRRSLQQKAGRVARFVAVARSRQRDLPVLNYAEGEHHLYLGESLTLKVHATGSSRSKVTLDRSALVIETGNPQPAYLRDLLRRWYREQAGQVFTERLRIISAQAAWTGGHTPPFRMRRMKRTWGSCSAAGLLTLNTHLVKAPPRLVDYVIAHEVCHLREHNHGKAFYALQEQLYPDWRSARTELRARGHVYLHE